MRPMASAGPRVPKSNPCRRAATPEVGPETIPAQAETAVVRSSPREGGAAAPSGSQSDAMTLRASQAPPSKSRRLSARSLARRCDLNHGELQSEHYGASLEAGADGGGEVMKRRLRDYRIHALALAIVARQGGCATDAPLARSEPSTQQTVAMVRAGQFAALDRYYASSPGGLRQRIYVGRDTAFGIPQFP